MIILRYSTSLQLKNHRSYDKNIKRVIFQNFQILSIFFRHMTWTSLSKCLIIWKEKFAKPISINQIAYCNQLLFILVKKIISSHEIKRNTSFNGSVYFFFTQTLIEIWWFNLMPWSCSGLQGIPFCSLNSFELYRVPKKSLELFGTTLSS